MILELESHFNRVGIILSFHQLDFKTTAASGVARGQAPGCSSRRRSLRSWLTSSRTWKMDPWKNDLVGGLDPL